MCWQTRRNSRRPPLDSGVRKSRLDFVLSANRILRHRFVVGRQPASDNLFILARVVKRRAEGVIPGVDHFMRLADVGWSLALALSPT